MGDNVRYADPQYECDLILKGGITSGIVYPPAIAEIASDHRLRGIGGTSAGAIGAAAAAAAELGRDSATGGFARLAQLPGELKQTDDRHRTLLLRLFQPQPETRPLFDMIWGFRSRRGWRRIGGGLADVARQSWRSWWGAFAVAVAVVGAGMLAVAASRWSLLASVPLLAVVTVVVGAVRLSHGVPQQLSANFFGLCNGMSPPGATSPALTDWLHEQLQTLAGRRDPGVDAEAGSRPVTFGELADHGVELVVLSTNLSRGTSETIPFREQVWAFDPTEWSRLFPSEVVSHLCAHPSWPADPEHRHEIERLGLCPLPAPEQLPIIVAARMSLSFPVLLSAVPLYGLTPRRTPAERGGDTYVRNWFSDGGITSNLPVRLFDAVVPGRPTYGINLAGGADPSTDDPAANVWRPMTTQQGGLPPTADIASIAGLLSAVFDTMQNWVDNDDSRAVGFRDRICTIRLGEGEGGMNLDMTPATIDGLVARGTCAGDNLASIRRGVRAFAAADDLASGVTPDVVANQWDRHRWIRFRIAIAGLSTVRRGLRARWTPAHGTAPYRDLVDSLSPDGPGWQSYRSDWSSARRRSVVDDFDAAPSVFDEDWVTEGAPGGVAIGVGPDRRAGRVQATSSRRADG
jgi:hypothetical protein